MKTALAIQNLSLQKGMKIALAIENFSLHGGGAESYSVELARTLVSEGWEVHLFGHSRDKDPQGAVFHRIPRLPKWVPPSVRMVHFALAHRRMVKQERFDVVVGFGNTLTMNVYQSHGGVHHYSSMRKTLAIRNPVARLFKVLAMFLTPKYHARAWIESAPFRMKPRPTIVAISEMVRRDLAGYFGLPAEEIRLVYNGIDVGRFGIRDQATRDRVRRALGFQQEVLFLFMAYDFTKKGVRSLVEAAAELRDRVEQGRFGVVVVGGSPSPSLKRLVRKLGLESTLIFRPPTKEPESLYAACDVFILPTFYDACSLVVFEAMAAGLPAITTVFNGAAGIISSGVDGLILSDPRDTAQMAKAMERFLEPQLLKLASAAAREKASKYSLERNHSKMMDIFCLTAGIPSAT